MRKLLHLLLLVSAFIGFAGQAFARLDLPQPQAAALRPFEAAGDHDGMEAPSDLLGEAHMTEAEERSDLPLSILDLMSIKGWAVAALAPSSLPALAAPETVPSLPVEAGRYFTAFGLTYEEADPPRR